MTTGHGGTRDDADVKIGWVGLGKLGLPCALALAAHGGHDVIGYDVSEWPWRVLAGEVEPPREKDLAEMIGTGLSPRRDGNQLLRRAKDVSEVVAASDVVFVAVPTPHAPAYGGEKPVQLDPRDFEYAYLTWACRDVCQAAAEQRKYITMAVVSTVLPGTMNRLIRPLLGEYVELAYTPHFIAMGTVVPDFLKPEFVICGTDSPGTAAMIGDVFFPVHKADLVYECGIETAEAIKVLYNLAISSKIVFANTVMELCHKTGADCDVVTSALSLATDRVVSPKYMRGGMGDGGACHPRDMVAMSWLAQRLELSYDLFGELIRAREAQTQWLAGLVRSYAAQEELELVILGRSYKPGSALQDGSPAILLAHYLKDLDPLIYDPYVPGGAMPDQFRPSVFVIATAHEEFYRLRYPPHSIVIDPSGLLEDQQGVLVIRVGRK